MAKDLSVDQKPDDPKEKARIESQGGYVSKASDAYGPARVWKGGFGARAPPRARPAPAPAPRPPRPAPPRRRVTASGTRSAGTSSW